MIKLPQALMDDQHRYIALDHVIIVESCFYEDKLEDHAFITEHELIYIISGELIIHIDGRRHVIRAGEAALAKRGSYFFFQKLARAIGQSYESLLFFIQEDFVSNFIHQYELQTNLRQSLPKTLMTIPSSPMLGGFMLSLLPYFDQDIKGKRELLQLKTYELLIQLLNVDPQLFSYFFQLNEARQADLVEIMEKHFTQNLPIKEFALLSGRSVSTFKRDFKKVFKDTPAKWLKKKRLHLARKLLSSTPQRPTEIYLQVGFENYAHFSKAFKAAFGVSPAQYKLGLTAM